MAGVDVFFVISGFIMVYASRPLFAQPGARSVFLARRFARIAPLYWAVTTIYLLIAWVLPSVLNQPVPSAWKVAASYLFIPATRPDGLVQPLYSLGWTLNYEMFFYVLFAGVLGLRFRAALLCLLAMLLGLVVAGSIAPLPQPLGFWTDPIILEFAFGVGLGFLHHRGAILTRPIRLALVAAALAMLALGPLGSGGELTLARPLQWGLPAAALVAAAALTGDRAANSGLLTRLCAALGDMSYAIYLIHPFVIRGIAEMAVRTGIAGLIGPWGFVVAALAGTLVAASVVHFFLERPVTAWVRRRLTRTRSAGPVSSPGRPPDLSQG